MEERRLDPHEVRLAMYAIIDGIREGRLIPSSVIELIDQARSVEIRDAMSQAYEQTASPEYKERVEKVRYALKVLEKFDKPN